MKRAVLVLTEGELEAVYMALSYAVENSWAGDWKMSGSRLACYERALKKATAATPKRVGEP